MTPTYSLEQPRLSTLSIYENHAFRSRSTASPLTIWTRTALGGRRGAKLRRHPPFSLGGTSRTRRFIRHDHGSRTFTAAGGTAGKQLRRAIRSCTVRLRASTRPCLNKSASCAVGIWLSCGHWQPEVSSAASTDRRKATTVSGLPQR